MPELILALIEIPAVPAISKKRGGIDFEITDKKLVIKHGDEKLFDDKPAHGKKWKVSMMLDIVEMDA